MPIGANASFMDPRTVITHFHLRPGDSVADFGAGTGHYLGALSQAVSGQGKVYAFEIQKALVENLTKKINADHLLNVHALWCDLEVDGGTKLKDGLLDAGILMNTLFQFENRVVALKEIGRVTRKGGLLFVVDWSESFGGMGPHYSQVLGEADAKTLVTANGYTFERDFPAGDHHYGLVFRKE